MFAIPEQLSIASKGVLAAQLSGAHAFSQALLDSSQTLIELNVTTLKNSLDAASAIGSQLIAARDTQEFVSLSNNFSQQAIERARDYGQQASSIAQGTRAKLTEVAETELAHSKEKMGELVDAVKKAPGEAGTPINSFFKSAVDSVQAGYNKMAEAGKQVQGQFNEAGAAAARTLQPVA